jgi:predicted neuraminidase
MIFKQEFVHEPSEKYPSCHGSSIVALPNGDLLAAWFAGTKEKDPDVAELISRKVAGSDHWSPLEIIHKTPGRSEGNTALFMNNGKLFFFFNTMFGGGWTMTKIRFKISVDLGKTWSEPIWFRNKIGWLIRNQPIALKNGEILVPVCSEVIGYKSFVMISSDNGNKWKKYGHVKPNTMQPTVVQLSDESLLMYMRTAGLNYIYQSRSTDNGRHWSKALPTMFKNPNAGIDLLRCKSGNLVLAFNDSTTGRTPLCLALSENEGKTWLSIKNVETNHGEYSYPYMNQDNKGIIHLVYTYNRKKIKHVEFDEEWLKKK